MRFQTAGRRWLRTKVPLPTVVVVETEISAKVEFEFDGFLNGWTDVTDDVVIEEGMQWDRGLPGSDPRDCVAKTGLLSFSLDNSDLNSAGLPGLYTLEHTNVRVGFVKNVGVRLSLVVNGSAIEMFTGRLRTATPSVGQVTPPTSRIIVADYMYQFVRRSLGSFEIQQDISDHDVFAMLVAAMPVQPRQTRIDAGFDTLPYVFHNMKTERARAVTEIKKLCDTTQAIAWVDRLGAVVYEDRSIRARNSANTLTITEDDLPRGDNLDVADDADEVINRVQVTVHPPTVEGSEVVLFSLEGVVQIQPNTPLPIRGLYTEPGLRARRAGGLDMLPAAPGTDYEFNTAADGSGADVTADVTVDTTFTANSIIFTIESPVACWMITLQARGIGVYDNANAVLESENQDSIDEIGENALALDLPYSGDVVFAEEVARYRLSLAQQNAKRVHTSRFELWGLSAERAAQIALRDVSDRIGFEEFMNALPTNSASGFYINAISGEVDGQGRPSLRWLLGLADSTQYWQLEIPGFSELEVTTRLGFSLIVGHTDVDHSDVHADTTHVDVAHADAHSDTAHSDVVHADVAHDDGAHGDGAHGDVAHSDVAHSDDAHGDTAHTDTAHSDGAHSDTHDDIPHWDVHSDIEHRDTHNDYTLHGDSGHDDAPAPHQDAILDHGDAHTDDAHGDEHGDTFHVDTHADAAHGDVAHQDVSHADSHGDSPHGDVTHNDTVHTDAVHGDTAHADQAHADTAHADVAHSDVAHGDVTHEDSHGDIGHGDIN